jgi:hypothetical protein
LHGLLIGLLQAERRVSPLVRPRWNALFREPSAAVLQFLISRRRTPETLGLAQERGVLGEEAFLDSILHDMGELLRQLDARVGTKEPRVGFLETMLRARTCPHASSVVSAGNAFKLNCNRFKSHGAVRAELRVHEDLPESLQRGLFAHPRSYRAWVQFASAAAPGARDLDVLAPLAMNVKLLGVPGPKLLDDERHTHDLIASSVPTSATPDVRADAQLQGEILRGTPLFYFFNRQESHVLDFLMQLLWNHTQTSPLECDYFSGTPYLLGEGQAMKFCWRSRVTGKSRIAGLFTRASPNYLRENMARTLSNESVEFELLVQVQTDPHRMPIEDATVMWPEHMSPHLPVATLRIPQQTFDSPGQLEFAESLNFTPWHAIAAHRPLGNQNRARRRSYWELSRFRQTQALESRSEPTGDEVFDLSVPDTFGSLVEPLASNGAHRRVRSKEKQELRPRLH